MIDDDPSEGRFSDRELLRLRADFTEHAARFDSHVIRYDEHMIEFRRHVVEEERKWGQLATMVHENTQATERIAEAIEKQAASTEGVVQLYRDAQGTIRTGRGVTRFTLWLASLGAVGAAVAAVINWLSARL